MKVTESDSWWVPRLRTVEAPYVEWRYDVASIQYLPAPKLNTGRDLFSALETRQSRCPTQPVLEADLAALLWFTCKTKAAARPGMGRWEHRPVPSAGGRHPIDVLLANWPTGSNQVFRYDPQAHALWRLRLESTGTMNVLISAVEDVCRCHDSVIMFHAAQFARTISRYEEGESLVWRDAGALLGLTTIVAEALGLDCCPFGLTGEPALSTALGADGVIEGVGGCVVGERTEEAVS